MNLPAGWEERMIATNGVRLHVVTAGDPGGRPVVLLHGFPEFWYGWRHQIPALAAAGYRVIVPDQRGYNLSDVPKGAAAYRTETLVNDVLGLLDHFGCGRVRLAGHDWGAAVAWSLAIRHPERLEKLAILNVPHPDVMWRTIRSSPRQMLKSWYIGFFQVPGLADGLLRMGQFAGARRVLRASGGPATFSEADLDEYRRAWANSGGLAGMIGWYRAAVRFRAQTAGDRRVHVPVLILWGRRDVALGAGMAQRSLELCDDGRLVYFDGATHWVQHDAAYEVNREMIAFFD